MAAASLCILGCSREQQPSESAPKDAPTLFATRPPLEVDTIASMWLLQRFVFTNAQFEVVPHGVPLTNGIPFDTPEAEFRRYATLCCFESILRKHPVDRPGMEKLAAMVHDIEINHWGPPRHPEAIELNRALSEILEEHAEKPEASLPAAFRVLDETLNSLGDASSRNRDE